MAKNDELNAEYRIYSRVLYSRVPLNEEESFIRNETLYQHLLNNEDINEESGSFNCELYSNVPENEEKCYIRYETLSQPVQNNEDLNEDYRALSRVLYSLGYKKESCIRNATCYQHATNKVFPEEFMTRIKFLVAGSTAEGILSSEDDNLFDIDILNELKDFYCYDPQQYTRSMHARSDMHLFEAVNENTGPGYTRLKCLNPDGISYVYLKLEFRFKKLDGQIFLLNNPNMLIRIYGTFKNKINGPAITLYLYENKRWSVDVIAAIPYQSNYLQKWTNRSFPQNWPSPELLHEISHMKGHVVPVGNKNSPHREIEWRICYTEVECLLVHSLNTTQLHVYLLLKLITKVLLKPACKDTYISSYMIKNVVFWMAALLPSAKFQDKSLMVMLMTAIKVLYGFVKSNSLPNFMIPARNLMSERMSEADREQVKTVLEEVLRRGPGFLLQKGEFRDLQKRIRTERELQIVTKRTAEASLTAEFDILTEKFLQQRYSISIIDSLFPIRQYMIDLGILEHIKKKYNKNHQKAMSYEEFNNLYENATVEDIARDNNCILFYDRQPGKSGLSKYSSSCPEFEDSTDKMETRSVEAIVAVYNYIVIQKAAKEAFE